MEFSVYPKEQGGLGVQNLDTKNKSLLGKWFFKLLNEEGVWQTLLTRKYLGEKSLSQAGAELERK